MFSQNGKISGRQCFRLYLFDFIGVSSLILPTYLARTVGVGGVFSIILGVVWGLLYLLFLYEVHGKMETDLGCFLHESIPAWARVAVQMWLIAHCVAVSGFAAYLFGVMIQYSLLEGESFIIIIAVILAIAAYAVSGGIESRARVYEVLFWFVLVPFAVMIAAAGMQSRAVYFEGLWDVGFLDIMQGSYMVFLLFAVAFWTLFLARHFREDNSDLMGIYYKKIALAIIIAGIFLAAAYLVCLGNFGQSALSEMDFPIITLMSSISIPGNFVKRLDALMIAVWFFMLFAFLNLHIFYGTQMMRDLVKEPESESVKQLRTGRNGTKDELTRTGKAGDNMAGIFLAAVVIFSGILALVFYYNASAVNAFFGYIYYIGTPLLVVMPFVIYWIGRGRRT